jgi:hypothetical protein
MEIITNDGENLPNETSETGPLTQLAKPRRNRKLKYPEGYQKHNTDINYSRKYYEAKIKLVACQFCQTTLLNHSLASHQKTSRCQKLRLALNTNSNNDNFTKK